MIPENNFRKLFQNYSQNRIPELFQNFSRIISELFQNYFRKTIPENYSRKLFQNYSRIIPELFQNWIVDEQQHKMLIILFIYLLIVLSSFVRFDIFAFWNMPISCSFAEFSATVRTLDII
jgi:hypothetical protein